MTELPGFDVLLARLASHRQPDIADLSRTAGVPEPELRAVFGGTEASPSLLRRLATALHLHPADLCVIADVAVPDEWAALDVTAGGRVPYLVRDAMSLRPEQRRRLRQLVRSLPQENRTRPVPVPRAHEQYERGPGAVLLRMIGNRNLNWSGTAKTFLCLTGRYWSAATYGMVGHGLKELTPDLLVDFGTVLGVPVDTLSVLTGIDVPDGTPPQKPASADVAELIWDVRRLTADQVRQVGDAARAMLRA